MSEDLASIQKPIAESFRKDRKLFSVPLIFSGQESPSDFLALFDTYWDQVQDHLANLESRLGHVRHLYHESLLDGGENSMQVLETLSPKSHVIVGEKCKKGAILELVEDPELAAQSDDWERCLLLGFASQKVAQEIYGLFIDATKNRHNHMVERIDATLEDGESGILFVRERNWLQFPNDIQIFSVAPPALDGIHRWFRDLSSGN